MSQVTATDSGIIAGVFGSHEKSECVELTAYIPSISLLSCKSPTHKRVYFRATNIIFLGVFHNRPFFLNLKYPLILSPEIYFICHIIILNFILTAAEIEIRDIPT